MGPGYLADLDLFPGTTDLAITGFYISAKYSQAEELLRFRVR